ncbi:MAG: SCO family protein [Vicinamibacterales bacterium]
MDRLTPPAASRTTRPFRISTLVLAGVLAVAAGCQRAEAPKQYPLVGQVLGVDTKNQALTIKHDDVPGLMPGMTMSFPVASPDLLEGRTPGELITATLEVSDATGRIVSVTHTGSAPLPEHANAAELASHLLDVGDEVPDAAFLDSTDARRSFSEWRGSWTVVTFIYTQCPLPNYCPLMDQNFSMLQTAIGEDPALRGHVKLVSISFDPAHDTPAVLAAHAAKRKADPAVWTFLTADQVTIDRFAARFGVGLLRPEEPDAAITHNLRTALIDPDGKIRTFYTGNTWTPADVLADLRGALGRP